MCWTWISSWAAISPREYRVVLFRTPGRGVWLVAQRAPWAFQQHTQHEGMLVTVYDEAWLASCSQHGLSRIPELLFASATWCFVPDMLPHLETFAKAAELSSFTSAAKQLGISQAAVSQRIRMLEAAVRKSLFVRRGRRVEVSDAGRTLYEYAQRIDTLHQEARATLAGQKAKVVGELEVAASSVPGEHLLPSLLKSFRREHPLIRVRASVSDSLAVVKQVEQGHASVGLTGRRLRTSHLEFRAFASDRLVVVAAPDHPLAKKRIVSLAQLLIHPMVLREVGSAIRHSFEEAMDQAGLSIEDSQIAMELGSNEAIRAAVREGIGVAMLSDLVVRADVEAGRLAQLHVPSLQAERTMYVVLARKRVLPQPARLFVAHVSRANNVSPSS